MGAFEALIVIKCCKLINGFYLLLFGRWSPLFFQDAFGQAWQNVSWLYVNPGQEKSTCEQIRSGWEDEKKRGANRLKGVTGWVLTRSPESPEHIPSSVDGSSTRLLSVTLGLSDHDRPTEALQPFNNLTLAFRSCRYLCSFNIDNNLQWKKVEWSRLNRN